MRIKLRELAPILYVLGVVCSLVLWPSKDLVNPVNSLILGSAIACTLLAGFVTSIYAPRWLEYGVVTLPLVFLEPRLLLLLIPSVSRFALDVSRGLKRPSDVDVQVMIIVASTLAIIMGLYDSVSVLLPILALIPLAAYVGKRASDYTLLIISAYLALAALVAFKLGFTWLCIVPLTLSAELAVILASRVKPRLKEQKRILVKPPKEITPFITAYAIMASVMIIDFLAGLALVLAYPGTPLSFTGAFVAAYGITLAAYYICKIAFMRPEIAMKPLKSRWYTAFLVERPKLFNILERYTTKVRILLEKAAILEDPILYSAKHLMVAIVLLVALPSCLMFLPLNMYLALAVAVGLVLGAVASIVVPIVVLSMKVGDRKRSVENELPWLAIFATCMQAAGIPLYEAMKKLLGKGLLPAMEKEARLIEKRVMVLGRDYLTAMEEVARDHPSRLFRDLLLGYTSIIRTGGDPVGYLESRVRELLAYFSLKLKSYADAAAAIGEVCVALFAVLSAVFAVAGGGLEGTAAMLANAFAYLGVPMICAVIYSYLMTSQPKISYRIPVGHLIPAVGLIGASAYLAVAGQGLGWYSVAVVMLVLGFAYGIQHFYWMKVAKDHEAALEDFLRDVTEMRKIGLPPSRAIHELARSRHYNVNFDSLVKFIDAQLQLNVPLAEAVQRIDTPSWLTKMVFFILGEIEATGGGTIRVLEQLTNFVADVKLAMKEMKAKLRLFEAMVFIAPVLLSSLVSLGGGMAEAFAAKASEITSTMEATEAPVPTPIFMLSAAGLDIARMVVVISCAAMAVLAGKVCDFSAKSLLRLAIVAAILLFMNIYVDPLLRSMTAAFFTIR